MSRHHGSQGPRIDPPRLPVVAMNRRVGGWWPLVASRCQYGACGGVMTYASPDGHPGRVYCVSCSRSTHEVVETICVRVPLSEIERPRRGRPAKVRAA